MPVPNLLLAIPWSDRRIALPPPIDLGATIFKTDYYRQWIESGHRTKLEFTDESGRRVTAEAWGVSEDEEGRRRAIIPGAQLRRADGTLEKHTSYDPMCRPSEWTTYAADRQTKLVRVRNRVSGKPGAPFVQYVLFFHADGPPTELKVDEDGAVEREMVVTLDDEEGYSSGRYLEDDERHSDFSALATAHLAA